jgi:hypothetical protein
MADQKQVIGRGTRTCGQKGLEFHPIRGWPLEVFVYDLEIPEKLRLSLLGSQTAEELLMKAMNKDIRLANLEREMEKLAVVGSVDYELNKAVHNFSVDFLDEDADEIVLGGAGSQSTHSNKSLSSISELVSLRASVKKVSERISPLEIPMKFGHEEIANYVKENYSQFKWTDVKMENLCGDVPQEWKNWDPEEPRSSQSSRRSSKRSSRNTSRRSSKRSPKDELSPIFSELSEGSYLSDNMPMEEVSKYIPPSETPIIRESISDSVCALSSPDNGKSSHEPRLATRGHAAVGQWPLIDDPAGIGDHLG